MNEKIVFTDDDGNEIELFVVEETRINNVNYILVTEDGSEEAEAYIFKDVSDDKSDEAVYEPVEEEDEIQYIGKIFSELLEDTDII